VPSHRADVHELDLVAADGDGEHHQIEFMDGMGVAGYR
jgi:hypothetical protein